jgi:flavodoxin
MKSYLLRMSVVLWLACLVNIHEGAVHADQASTRSVPQEKQASTIEKGNKVQVIFYSRTGRTKMVADAIKDILDGDVQEVKDLKDRSGIMGFISGMIDVRKNPTTAISPESVSIEEYDVLFVGSPIWGMKFAPAITTFLDSTTNFRNKKVVLFATTAARMKQSAFDEYSTIIREKGGEVIDTFFIKTLWKDPSEIKEEVKEIVGENKDRWIKEAGENE